MKRHCIPIACLLVLFSSCASFAQTNGKDAEAHILNDKFTVSTKAADLPPPIAKELGEMVDRTELFSSGCVGPGAHQRLVFLAKNAEHSLVVFETGGIAFSYQAQLYALENKAARMIWSGYFWQPLPFTQEAVEQSKKPISDAELLELFRSAVKKGDIKRNPSKS